VRRVQLDGRERARPRCHRVGGPEGVAEVFRVSVGPVGSSGVPDCGVSLMVSTMGSRAEPDLKRPCAPRVFSSRSAPAGQDRGVASSWGTAARVLVVEDEAAIRESVVEALDDAGFRALGRGDGDGLEELLDGFRPDLVVLDVMLPGRDGFRLLSVVRGRSDAGLVMLTARDGLDDRLHGLDTGADDYVVKPFLLAELVSRVRAVLRRRGRVPTAVTVGDLVVDDEAGTATRAGTVLDLTATELRLLRYLVEQRGRTVTKNQILTQVWGYDAYDPNLVEVHVSALRRKLEAHGPRIVHTVRGLGYALRPAPGEGA
jgi:two-component system, OmpR family, response regulator